MNLKTNALAMALCVLFAACSNKDKKDNYDYTITTNPAPTGTNPVNTAQPAAAQPVSAPVLQAPPPGATVQQVQQPQNVNIQPAHAAQTAAGTNPPPGQPGHRCDIAVGAPLNSAPTTTQAAVTPAQQPVVQQVKTAPVVQQVATPTPQKTAPGMNPPHGQPGHRCDIAVGAPLNSKPAAAPAAPVQVQPTISAPPTPAKSDTGGKR